MDGRTRWSVVNLASVAGIRSTGVIAAYGASKAALIRLTEELAWQLGPRIRVNAVAPGIVKTQFAAAWSLPARTRRRRATPMKRLGTPPRTLPAWSASSSPTRRRGSRAKRSGSTAVCSQRDRCSAPVVSTDNFTADVVIVGGGRPGGTRHPLYRPATHRRRCRSASPPSGVDADLFGVG